ncbi:hypothetical protein ScPMuIL_015725 [Solemya velum]
MKGHWMNLKDEKFGYERRTITPHYRVHIEAPIFGIAAGLSCHECTSQEVSSCLDVYSEDNTGDCSAKSTHCAKYKTVAKLQDSGFMNGDQRVTTVVSRLCTKKPGRSDGCTFYQGSGSHVIECLCSTDNCNGGVTVRSNVITSVLVTLVSVLIFWRFH